jgi:hypothetical protein
MLKVSCSIEVSVDLKAALGTRVGSLGERQFSLHMSAPTARLTAGIELRSNHKLASVPLRLVRKLSPEFCPSGIRNMLGKAVVAKHALNA